MGELRQEKKEWINIQFITHLRKLMTQLAMIEVGVTTWDDAPDEFITSYDMCKRDHHS